MIRVLFLLCIGTFLLVMPIKLEAGEARFLKGPVEAELLEVVDGDTLRVRARIWLGQSISILVRLRDIDAPELKRSKCLAEKKLAEAARHRLVSLVQNRSLLLTDIAGGKYYGRVLAHVQRYEEGIKRGGRDNTLSRHMLGSNLVRPYKRGKRQDWCDN